MNPKVDWFFQKAGKWQTAYQKLRAIVLECGLTEELKWGVPCYTFESRNVLLIHGFTDYCALLFTKGVLLKDDKGLLVQQTKNVQAARQIRFSEVKEIDKLARTLKAYIFEAIEVERAGLKVRMKDTASFEMPVEFEQMLKKASGLRKAFEALTPGRQRGYLLYFSQPKQKKTREARIEKSIPLILRGKGLNDD